MPVTMGGMASGVDTDAVIEKLVEVEARPIRQWVSEKNRSNHRKEALGVLRSHLSELNKSVKDLYGFRASYHNKRVISSDKSVIEAVANKTAENGMKKLEVKSLASTHKIASDPVKKNKRLPSGKIIIEVDGESETIGFRGGTLENLKEKIDDIASDLVTTSYVKTKPDTFVLTIESKISGKKGEIGIGGDKEFLKSMGLINGEKGAGEEKTDIIFNGRFFTSYIGQRKTGKEDGDLKILDNGKTLSITGVLWKEYVLPVETPVKKDTVLEFEMNYRESVPGEPDSLPGQVQIGPEEKIVIKGIELNSYNIRRVRETGPEEIKKEVLDISGIGVVARDKGNRIERIYELEKDAKGKQVIPVGDEFEGKNIIRIIFYCNEGNALFSNARIMTPKKGTGVLEPKNEIAGASDAVLKIDGVEIIRDKNTGIGDVIKGVTIDVHGVTRNPVTLTIEPNIDESVEKLKKFVKAYNDYLDINRELTRAEITSKPDDYENVKNRSGLFVGDMAILRLENFLKRAVSDAYPNRADDPIKIITQMGISTGALNADWENIREGKLILDESKLESTISDNPDGVMEFFGADTDGDNRIDSGMAYRVETLLKPYLMAGNNIIASKQKLEESNISAIDDKISRHQDHLKKYEDRLRSKFSAMEKAVSGAKAQKAWMQNQLKGMPDYDNNKKKNKQ